MTDTPETTDAAPLVRHDRNDDGVDVITLQHGKVNALSSAVLASVQTPCFIPVSRWVRGVRSESAAFFTRVS